MILREATIKYKGYDPNSLTKGSHKRICCSCDRCGRVRYIEFCAYRDLCKACSYTNEVKEKIRQCRLKNPISHDTYMEIAKINIGKKRTNKFCENQRLAIIGAKNPNWKGGYEKDRSHLLSKSQCLKLNNKFKGSHFHHITKSLGIYVPKELHRHIKHSLKTGLNIGSINLLALQFINGGL